MDLYKPIHEQFVRFCKARAYGDMPADDLVNEAILIAFEKLDEVNEKAFLGFLFGTAIRLVNNHNRRGKFWGMLDITKEDNQQVDVDDPELKVDVTILYESLAKLPKKTEEALILFEISGFSQKEIAEIQGDGLSAIKQRISRGREQLIALLIEKETAQSRTYKSSKVLASFML